LKKQQFPRVFPAKPYAASNDKGETPALANRNAIIHRKNEKKMRELSQSCEKEHAAA
jgi:hypothetical protein